MNAAEREELLKKAHQDYVDWWLPIDLESDSALAPMSYERFLGTLLTYSPETWWDRWIGDKVPKNKLVAFKNELLKSLIYHHVTFHINYRNEQEAKNRKMPGDTV